ncbi:uncharacterized protein UV8b_03905 [Ustilaginoidea virens]|uniref:endo-1,3(4)-beta-glucanase n=1 Tax=Ustilaginoidea virens TaxID=1159556 RepID=A0A1B5KSJ6_USTVR|nr:uncharacterized protein UV8b_03905 [Ustilaginoidea virens]QUC19664.1 hypothetical protein UV8b_03905 [Ustilaginoidea virens]GAO13863.1 hypothetical protein UVI_02004190 [Ustilaginoidea virens]
MRFSSSLRALGGTVVLVAGIARAHYQLETTYDTTNFFDSFDFFTGPDPTKGFVEYVDSNTANKEGLAGYAKGGIFMGVDYKTKNPAMGRKSVRVTSHKAFTRGLFIADIAHMPGSICGTWPAFWMFGPNWPVSGEIDIIEGVNAQAKNAITLHTKPGCTVSNHGSLASTKFVSADCGAHGTSAGCGQRTDDNQNYGDGFNAIGGGVYATEWTSDHIAIWFFPRSQIPRDIQAEDPNPKDWGTPLARFAGGPSCKLDDHFANNQLVFDTTFCGDWAGSPSVWGSDPECSALAPTCQDYVSNNPADFADAFWVVNSVKVYQKGAGDQGQSTRIQPTNKTRARPTLRPTSTNTPQPGYQPQPTTTSTQGDFQSQPGYQPQPTTTSTQGDFQSQPGYQPQPTTTSTQGDFQSQPSGQAFPSGQPQPTIPAPGAPQSQPSTQAVPSGQPQVQNDGSWNGKVWNGEPWGSRRRDGSSAKLFSL